MSLQRTIAGQVRRHRRQAGFSQASLAERSDLSTETISRIERGKFEPSVSSLLSVADALDVTLDVLVGRQRSDGQRPPRDHTAIATKTAEKVN